MLKTSEEAVEKVQPLIEKFIDLISELVIPTSADKTASGSTALIDGRFFCGTPRCMGDIMLMTQLMILLLYSAVLLLVLFLMCFYALVLHYCCF